MDVNIIYWFNYSRNGEKYAFECWVKGKGQYVWISLCLIAWSAHCIVLIIAMYYYCCKHKYSTSPNLLIQNEVYSKYLFHRLWPWLLVFTLTRLPTLAIRVCRFVYQRIDGDGSEDDDTYYPEMFVWVIVHNISDASFGLGNAIVWWCNRQVDVKMEQELRMRHNNNEISNVDIIADSNELNQNTNDRVQSDAFVIDSSIKTDSSGKTNYNKNISTISGTISGHGQIDVPSINSTHNTGSSYNYPSNITSDDTCGNCNIRVMVNQLTPPDGSQMITDFDLNQWRNLIGHDMNSQPRNSHIRSSQATVNTLETIPSDHDHDTDIDTHSSNGDIL